MTSANNRAVVLVGMHAHLFHLLLCLFYLCRSNTISLSLRHCWPFGQKEYARKAVFCFHENKSSARMYVCILYKVESQYITNSCKSTLEGPQAQLHHGIRCFTRHHRPQDGQIIPSYSADVLRPPIRTGWVLETSPSDHYWQRYVVGQRLVFLMVLELWGTWHVIS